MGLMILDLSSLLSLLRNRHLAQPCAEREALISRKTSNAAWATKVARRQQRTFFARGRRQAILQQALFGIKSKIMTEVRSSWGSPGHDLGLIVVIWH